MSAAKSFKLYYTPTSCGAASYIAANIAGLKFDREQVSLATHKTQTGVDFYTINPKGNVPTVVVDGVVLNENAACLQFVADQAPESKLAPANGTIERYVQQNLLSFLGTEVHASYGPLFYAKTEEEKVPMREKVYKKFDYISKSLLNNDKKFLQGENLTVADIYLFIILSWSGYVGVSFDKFPVVKAFSERIGALPQIQAAQKAIAAEPVAA